MAKLNGFGGSVDINSNTVAEVISWSTDDSTQMLTGSAKGDTRVVGYAGPITSKLNIEMFLDPSDTNGQVAITPGATLSSFELYISGSATDDYYYTCTSGVVESISKASPNDLATHNVSIHLNAALVQAQVA